MWPNEKLKSQIPLIIFLLIILQGCANPSIDNSTRKPANFTISVDGAFTELASAGTNVREVIEDAGISISDLDIIDPPLFTPVDSDLDISIVRVTESVEEIEQTIPFQRRSVRNESMDANEPPKIIQGGKPGLEEITVRIIYHDGLEYSRQEIQLIIVEQPQDEIVMIGVGSAPGNIQFPGILAYINGGNSLLLRGSTLAPQQINTNGDLDHRVFTLSPSGSNLLFSKSSSEPGRFNELWVVETDRDGEPMSLDIANVLWADWNPNQIEQPQIAFTTGNPTDLLPGWEANNDLWLVDMPVNEDSEFEPIRIIESYPATYGWWGGNYAWSPNGDYIAYSFADEVGLIEVGLSSGEAAVYSNLVNFTEFNTRSDWVWVPSLSWSPDSRYLAFSQHAGEDPDAANFDLWTLDVEMLTGGQFAYQSGMWTHPKWSPEYQEIFDTEQTTSKIAYLRAADPLDPQRSSYNLWLMDKDGSNTSQIFPAAGEKSHFSIDKNYLTWSPTGREIAFVFDDHLMILDLETMEAFNLTHDDSVASNPSWAPYGIGLKSSLGAVGDESGEGLESGSPVP